MVSQRIQTWARPSLVAIIKVGGNEGVLPRHWSLINTKNFSGQTTKRVSPSIGLLKGSMRSLFS